MNTRFGLAGKLAQGFAHSKLTPLIIGFSLLLGLGAVYLTPKEEEPQITVPMIDIQIPAPGLEAPDVERSITEPMERALWGLEGVEYIYSSSQAHGALITVRFKVNEPLEPSLVKVHHTVMAMKDRLNLGPQAPTITSYSIDDVPFLAVTFTSSELTDFDLRTLVAPIALELAGTPELAKVEILGGLKRSLRVTGNPDKMASHVVSMLDLRTALTSSHSLFPAGDLKLNGHVFDVDVGAQLQSVKDIENLPIGSRAGRIVRVKDVASVVDGPELRSRVSLLHDKAGPKGGRPAVTLSFSKRKGADVVPLSQDILKRLEAHPLPSSVETAVIRNYGQTASEKSKELIEHLLIATLSVSILIALAMGWRSALVVGIAIPVTLALTLAIYYFMGYTLNRVTLFALIFSIGILVDDAIVVVENIERYLKSFPQMGFFKATLQAVNEVGNPTILATFTVIAAILPMAFVRGLMGPYMKPIPVGASLAMMLSLFVAFIVTPWAALRLLKHHAPQNAEPAGDASTPQVSRLDRIYIAITKRLLSKKTWALGFMTLTLVLFSGAASMFAFKLVKVKMLPFDNKSEFQVTLDYPVSTALEQSSAWSQELSESLLSHPDVERVQHFTGEAAPFSFSGMVKHTFRRRADYLSDLHVVLKDKHDRRQSGHDIINELRPRIQTFAQSKGAVSKVLEIPPGPPVMATMVAEIYGPTREARREAGQAIHNLFAKNPSLVDLDVSWRPLRPRLVIPFDYAQGGLYGVPARQAWELGYSMFQDTPLFTIQGLGSPEDVPLELSLQGRSRHSNRPFATQTLMSMQAGVVQAERVLGKSQVRETQMLHRKNLQPVEYVLAELSGSEEAPVYPILDLGPQMPYPTRTATAPSNTQEVSIKWDGEWFITYEVFRDLGAAFAVVLVLIYVLVVGWFRSFAVPLVIMAPIPISLIGIIPGHYLSGAYFTATSMIGFIAGAGVIVRNSIILVDFIEQQLRTGMPLQEAVIQAGVLRFRPMLLTAAAVVVGSAVMLFDPIFQGLAVSLIFGEIAATILSRFAVPLLYTWGIGTSRVKMLQREASV